MYLAGIVPYMLLGLFGDGVCEAKSWFNMGDNKKGNAKKDKDISEKSHSGKITYRITEKNGEGRSLSLVPGEKAVTLGRPSEVEFEKDDETFGYMKINGRKICGDAVTKKLKPCPEGMLQKIKKMYTKFKLVKNSKHGFVIKTKIPYTAAAMTQKCVVAKKKGPVMADCDEDTGKWWNAENFNSIPNPSKENGKKKNKKKNKKSSSSSSSSSDSSSDSSCNQDACVKGTGVPTIPTQCFTNVYPKISIDSVKKGMLPPYTAMQIGCIDTMGLSGKGSMYVYRTVDSPSPTTILKAGKAKASQCNTNALCKVFVV